MHLDGIGTVTSDCKLCIHRTDIVKGVHWQYVKKDSTKEQLLRAAEYGYRAGGKGNAYYCSKLKIWRSNPNCDQECFVPDRDKIIEYLEEQSQRWAAKLRYVKEGHPLVVSDLAP